MKKPMAKKAAKLKDVGDMGTPAMLARKPAAKNKGSKSKSMYGLRRV